MTLRELCEKYDLDKEIIVVDPDTYWWLNPTFLEDENYLFISGEYHNRWEKKDGLR